MPTTSVAKTSATATTFRWVRRLAASSEKLFMTRSPAGGKEKRAAGVVWVRRLVLASRGLTGLLNPCVKSGTKLFQPYFINCFNCASPAVPEQRSPYQRLVVDTFGGSLCTSSGHSSSTSSRISSETSERPSVSSRNLCSRSKSSCTMMWSEIIRGAKIRFDFTLSVPLFVLFGWRHEPAHPLPTFSLRTVVICRLFSSHEETSEIPLSSSIVLRRFPPNRETTRSILVRDALAFVGKCAASS